jgi:hypothetical protein
VPNKLVIRGEKVAENQLSDYLKSLGADLVGFANLENINTSSTQNMNYGIALGIKLNPTVISMKNIRK